MRVFLGLTEVSGYYSSLAKGFNELGIEALHVPLQGHRFKYADTRSLPLLGRMASFCVQRRVGTPRKRRLARALWLVPVTLSRILLFLWAVTKFDVFILGGGSSFFRLAELPLLHVLGKRIVYVFHGTDARPAYIDGFFHELPPYSQSVDISAVPERPVIADAYIRASRARKRYVRMVEPWATAVVCVPSYAQFLTRPFYNFLAIGIPIRLDWVPELNQEAASGKVRILHAPSQRDAKGTLGIRKAVESLRLKGLPIDYTEISGRPNAEVLKQIARSDFVIDQLYSDTPMAGFATEAAYLGKPAVVGGYYAEVMKEDLPGESIPPSLFCLPEHIEAAIEKLTQDSLFRADLGRKAMGFVRGHWNARAVAARFLRLVEGSAPSEWRCESARLHYLGGAGLHETRVRQNIKAVVDRGGVSALQLDDKPQLRRRFLGFAQGETPTC